MKTILKTLFVCLMCSMSLVANAQLRFTSDQGLILGEDAYTPLFFGGVWSIENYEGGLNVYRKFPSSGWGNYKLFIDENGNVGVGKKPSAYKLEVAGDVYAQGTFKTSSDIRLKSNIENLSGCLSKITKLSGKSYFKKKNTVVDKQKEVEKLINSGLVSGDENGYLAIDYNGIIPVLIEALKEQQKIINKQKNDYNDIMNVINKK